MRLAYAWANTRAGLAPQPAPSQLNRNRPRYAQVLRIVGIVTALALAAILNSAATAQAQEEKPPAAPAAVEKPAAAPAGDDWERLIYLPYKNLKDVFEKEGATVFMPYLQFLKLWEKALPAGSRDAGKPPVAAVITEATYVGKVEKDLALIDADLTIQVLGKPWAELPIQFGDAAIGKITSTDNKILLRGTGDGTYSLLLPAAGEHKVRLQLVAKVRTSPDGRSIEMDSPVAGITTFDFAVPIPDQTIEILPQRVVAPVAGDNKITRVKANLGATKKIGARWHPKVSAAPVMEFLAGVQNVLEVRVADGLIHTQAKLTYQVLRGQLDQLRIAVPLKHRILDVTAPGLKSWKAVAEEKQQLVTVDLLSGEAKTITVEIHTERPAGDEPFEVAGIDDTGIVHGIHALGGVHESGLLIVSQSADLTLAVEQQTGLVRVEATEVPETSRHAESLYYKFYTPKFRLQVAAKAVEPRLLVDHRTQLVFTDDELRLTATLQYTVERAGVFELRFNVPENLKIDRVDCDNMKEFQQPAGANLLVVSLKEKTKGQITLVVTGHLALEAKSESKKLPLLEPLSVARENGSVLVYAPESLEVITDEKGLQAVQPSRPDPSTIPQLPNVRLASAWTYTRRPVEIPVKTERKPTRLSAAVGTTINVKQDLVEVSSLLLYSVQYAGIDTFRFAVPEAAAASTQVELADGSATAIKQKSHGEPENGWVTWTVIMQREITGTVGLRVRYDIKPEQKGTSASFSVQPVRVLDSPGKTGDDPEIKLAAVQGEVAVQKDRSLAVAAKGDDVETIDVRELGILPQEGYLAYRYFKQPEKLEQPFKVDFTSTRHEIQEVVETVVMKALVEASVTTEKSVIFRCRYLMKTSERQRLAIDLPNFVEPLDTLVAGKSVDLEKNEAPASGDKWQSFFVNVARKTSSDEPFVLSLVFRVPHPDRPLKGWSGMLLLQLPRIGGATPQGHSKIAIQQLRTAIWVPRDYALVGTPQNFTPDTDTHFDLIGGAVSFCNDTTKLESWFGDQTGGLFAFPTSGHAFIYNKLGGADELQVKYWRTARFTWVISGMLVLIGLILVRTSWENRLTILLLLAFGCAMYGLQDADEMVNALAAARYGLIAMLAYWLIHALSRPRAKQPVSPELVEITGMGCAVAAVIPPPGVFEPEPKSPDKPS